MLRIFRTLCLCASALVYINCSSSAGSGDDGTTPTTPPDKTAPTVKSSVPAMNGSLPANSNITVTFSENIKAGSGNITLTATGDTKPAIMISDTTQVTIASDTLTINPATDLTNLTSMYTLTLPSGVVQDSAGNPNAMFTLTLMATMATVRPVVLWAHTPHIERNGNLGDRATVDNLCKNSTAKPMAATGTITKAFIAYSSTDWPKTFTIEDGTKLTEHTTEATPVYGASSSTTTLTDANEIANNYNAFLTKTTDLSRSPQTAGVDSSTYYWSGMEYTAGGVLSVSATNCSGWSSTSNTGSSGLLTGINRGRVLNSVFASTVRPMCSSTTDAGLLCITY